MLLTVRSLARIALFAAVAGNALAAAPPATVTWTKQTGDWSRVRAIAPARDGGLLAAVTSLPCASVATLKTENGITNRFTVMKYASDGQLVFERDIPRPEQETPRKSTGPLLGDIRAMTVLSTDEIVVVVDFNEHQPWIVKLDRDGAVVFMKQMPRPQRVLGISRVVAGSEGDFYLVGHADANFYTARMSAAGQLLWEQLVDRGRFERLHDAVIASDGNLVATGTAGTLVGLELRDSDSVTMAFTPAGQQIAERRVPGRFGRVAKAGDRIGLVYEASRTGPADPRIVFLDSRLRELVAPRPLARPPLPQELAGKRLPVRDELRIAPAGEATFAVFATDPFLPYLALVSAGAKDLAMQQLLMLAMPLDYEVARSRNRIYIAESAIPEGSTANCMKVIIAAIDLAPGAGAQ